MPHRILIPPGGLAERAVFAALELSWREVYPLLGGERLGAPRDYRSGRHGTIYTRSGVARLAEAFGRDVELVGPEDASTEKFWWREDT